MPRAHTVCFKVDAATAEAMQGIPNRSAFLRSAVLAALSNTCPVCRGTGHLSPRQMAHWRSFAAAHAFEKCAECQEYRWVCAAMGDTCQPAAPSVAAPVVRPRARRPSASRPVHEGASGRRP